MHSRAKSRTLGLHLQWSAKLLWFFRGVQSIGLFPYLLMVAFKILLYTQKHATFDDFRLDAQKFNKILAIYIAIALLKIYLANC